MMSTDGVLVVILNIDIKKNKRNFLPQRVHLEAAREKKKVLKNNNLLKSEGRPKGSGTKEQIINEWQQLHPCGTVSECSKALNVSRTTVYKYWKG